MKTHRVFDVIWLVIVITASIASACSVRAMPTVSPPADTSRPPEASRGATAAPSPQPAMCPFVGEPPRGGPETFDLFDLSGLVAQCHVAAADDAASISVVNISPEVIEIRWVEGACADRGAVSVSFAGAHLRVVLRVFPLALECPAIGLPYAITLRFVGPVDAELIEVVREEVKAAMDSLAAT